jgi:hypothetical protein
MAALQIGELDGCAGCGCRVPRTEHAPRYCLPAAVSFPFGLLASGDYRIFVQVKRDGRIETGAFDAASSESLLTNGTTARLERRENKAFLGPPVTGF